MKQAFGARNSFADQARLEESTPRSRWGLDGHDRRGRGVEPGLDAAAIHLYVKDADAVYKRALKPELPTCAPVDQDYGDGKRA